MAKCKSRPKTIYSADDIRYSMIKEAETGFILVGSVGSEIEATEIYAIFRIAKTGMRFKNLIGSV